jgi:fucose permease
MHFGFSIGATIAPLMLGIATQENSGESLTPSNGTATADTTSSGSGSFSLVFIGVSVGFIVAAASLLVLTSPPRPQSKQHADHVLEESQLASEPHEVQLEQINVSADINHGDSPDSPPVASSALNAEEPASPAPVEAKTVPALPAKAQWMLTFAAATVLFLYVGAEIAFGTYITSYAVLKLGMPESEAQYLAAVYWGALTAGRGCSIVLSVLVRPQILLMASIGISAIFATLFAVLPLSGPALWVVTVCFGFCMSPQYPSTFTFVNGLITMSAKHATVCSILVGLGAWLLPFIVAVSMGDTNTTDEVGPAFASTFTGIVAGGCCCNFLVILWMTRYASRLGRTS